MFPERRRRLRPVTVARTRGLLYSLARFLGDYQAAKKGRIGKRTRALVPPHTPTAR
jgi:hypothetical protein